MPADLAEWTIRVAEQRITACSMPAVPPTRSHATDAGEIAQGVTSIQDRLGSHAFLKANKVSAWSDMPCGSARAKPSASIAGDIRRAIAEGSPAVPCRSPPPHLARSVPIRRAPARCAPAFPEREAELLRS